MEIRGHMGMWAKSVSTDPLQLQLGYSSPGLVTGFRHSIRNAQEPGAWEPGSPEKVFRQEGGGVGHLFQLATPASVT